MVSAVIQARMGATRLPGKTLRDLAGKSLLAWTILAVRACPSIDRVVVATTELERDDPVAAEAQRWGAQVYRGDEDDVLARFIGAASDLQLDVMVRISGDSPVFSPWVCDGVVREYLQGQYDYASNTSVEAFPYGTQAEVFSRQVLEQSWAYAEHQADHEHVTVAIRRHPEVFRALSITPPEDVARGRYRLCVDTQEDYDVIAEIFANVPHDGDLPPDLADVVAFIDSRPDLRARVTAGAQKYSTSSDTDVQLDTVELSMRYRSEFLAKWLGPE